MLSVVNLLQQTPEDKRLADALLQFQGVVKLIEFKSPHFFQDKSTENVTYMMKLEGRYTEILKVLYALENQSGFGSISHTSFEKQNNHRTQKEHLQSSVFLKPVY